MDMAKNVLREQLHVVVRSITIEDIQKKIADYYGIAPKEMKSNKRSRNLAFPRQVAMYISKELTQALHHHADKVTTLFICMVV